MDMDVRLEILSNLRGRLIIKTMPGGREGTSEKEKTIYVKGYVGGDRSSLFHVKIDLTRPAYAPVSGDIIKYLRLLVIRRGRLTI
jgi:hypothetical protein